MSECEHPITLVGVVERCAECKVELSHRPPLEAELRAQNRALCNGVAKASGALTLAVDLMIQADSPDDYTQALRAIEYAQGELEASQSTD